MAQEPVKDNSLPGETEPGKALGLEIKPAATPEVLSVREIEAEPPAPNFMLFGFGAVLVLVLAVVAMLLITSGDVTETPAPAALSSQATEGKQLFLASNCASCHPAEGRAGGTGPRLSTINIGDGSIKNIIQRGKGAMPSNGKLTNEQLDQLVAYIRAIKPLS